MIPGGSVNIVQGRWGGTFRANTPVVSDYILMLHAGGAGTAEHERARFALLPGRTGALFSPGGGAVYEGEAGDHETIVVARGALEAHLTALTGQAPGRAILFAPQLDLERGPGATVLQLTQLFRREAERPGGSPFLLAGLRDALFTSLLIAARHSHSHLFEGSPARIAPGCVKRAEEFIAAHAGEPITLADIVAAAGAPARSLRAAFTSSRGVAPMEMLRRHRFDLARQRLIDAAPGTTVASVVAALGLGNPGRFSVEYKKRFGVSPTATLALGRSGAGGVALKRRS